MISLMLMIVGAMGGGQGKAKGNSCMSQCIGINAEFYDASNELTKLCQVECNVGTGQGSCLTSEDGCCVPYTDDVDCVVDIDGDGVMSDVDCDDTNVNIYPGADEFCNFVDDNCDGDVDEATSVDAMTVYPDYDGDYYGDDSLPFVTCYPDLGFYVSDNTDCNDTNHLINPGMEEIVGDGIDNDCNPDTPDMVVGPPFFGIQHYLQESVLLDAGYVKCHQTSYGTPTTVTAINANCGGDLLNAPGTADLVFAASQTADTSTLYMAASVPNDLLIYPTSGIQGAVGRYYNGAWWYNVPQWSLGFGPMNNFYLNICDYQSATDPTVPEKMCWHMREGIGGWSAGIYRFLNTESTDGNWNKVVYKRDLRASPAMMEFMGEPMLMEPMIEEPTEPIVMEAGLTTGSPILM